MQDQMKTKTDPPRRELARPGGFTLAAGEMNFSELLALGKLVKILPYNVSAGEAIP